MLPAKKYMWSIRVPNRASAVRVSIMVNPFGSSVHWANHTQQTSAPVDELNIKNEGMSFKTRDLVNESDVWLWELKADSEDGFQGNIRLLQHWGQVENRDPQELELARGL